MALVIIKTPNCTRIKVTTKTKCEEFPLDLFLQPIQFITTRKCKKLKNNCPFYKNIHTWVYILTPTPNLGLCNGMSVNKLFHMLTGNRKLGYNLAVWNCRRRLVDTLNKFL